VVALPAPVHDLPLSYSVLGLAETVAQVVGVVGSERQQTVPSRTVARRISEPARHLLGLVTKLTLPILNLGRNLLKDASQVIKVGHIAQHRHVSASPVQSP